MTAQEATNSLSTFFEKRLNFPFSVVLDSLSSCLFCIFAQAHHAVQIHALQSLFKCLSSKVVDKSHTRYRFLFLDAIASLSSLEL